MADVIVPTILANDYPYIERAMKEIDEPYTELLPDMMDSLHERLENDISSVRERDPLMLAIVYTAREDAVQYMQPLLDSDNPKLPRLALAALYEGKQQAYIESLVPYLQHESPVIVIRTIEVIGGYNESIPHLVPLLDHENHGIVGKTVSALSWSRNREALAHLLPLLTHKDSRLVDYVCRALKRIPDDVLKTGFYDFLNTLSATAKTDLHKILNEIPHGNDLLIMWDANDKDNGEMI